MDICIFEDEKHHNLNPFALSRPVCELRTGTGTLRQKLIALLKPDRVFLLARDYLKGILQERDPSVSFDVPAGPVLFVNARIITDGAFVKMVNAKEETLFLAGEDLVAAQVKDGSAFAEKLRMNDLAGLRSEEVEVRMIEYPWDLIEHNGSEIEREFDLFGSCTSGTNDVHLLNPQRIFIGKGASLSPGVVIDATEGAVIIDEETTVMAHCSLKGPLYIGKHCLIKAGAHLYGPTSIGNTCKIGGEVTGSIFHGFANKQHDGFIGHSYIGEWVNIGAGTNNSDLKNNYKEVIVYVNNNPVNSGHVFIGTFMGDHSKTAINTVINTGTVIGFSVNLFGEGFPPKFVPSFSWGGKRKFMTYKLDDATETAKRVMQRRQIEMTDPYRNMMSSVFEQTKEMRKYGI